MAPTLTAARASARPASARNSWRRRGMAATRRGIAGTSAAWLLTPRSYGLARLRGSPARRSPLAGQEEEDQADNRAARAPIGRAGESRLRPKREGDAGGNDGRMTTAAHVQATSEPASARPVPRLGITIIAVAAFLLELAVSGRYGYVRD